MRPLSSRKVWQESDSYDVPSKHMKRYKGYKKAHRQAEHYDIKQGMVDWEFDSAQEQALKRWYVALTKEVSRLVASDFTDTLYKLADEMFFGAEHPSGWYYGSWQKESLWDFPDNMQNWHNAVDNVNANTYELEELVEVYEELELLYPKIVDRARQNIDHYGDRW